MHRCSSWAHKLSVAEESSEKRATLSLWVGFQDTAPVPLVSFFARTCSRGRVPGRSAQNTKGQNEYVVKSDTVMFVGSPSCRTLHIERDGLVCSKDHLSSRPVFAGGRSQHGKFHGAASATGGSAAPDSPLSSLTAWLPSLRQRWLHPSQYRPRMRRLWSLSLRI